MKNAFLIELIVLIIFLLIIALPWYFFSKYQCTSRWDKSGYESDFGIVEGCLIKVSDKWIPAENYREI